MKTKSLYGFSPQMEPFVAKTPAEQVELLDSWGNTAIFGGYQTPEFVAAAHAAGMAVYAEFGCFVGQKWWREIPDSRPVTSTGEPLEAEEWYYGVNPTTPIVRERRLAALEELLVTHAIDGVWLDFIRWPCHWEDPHPHLPRTSFDSATLGRFRRDTGIEIPIRDPASAARRLLGGLAAEWTAWRCDQITTWVAGAKAIVRRTRPDALLGLFGVPWQRSDFDGAILSVIGQDYSTLGEFVDVFSPMVYHTMCGRPVEWIDQVSREVHRLSGKPVWPIIQSVDEPAPLSAREYGRAMDIALDSSATAGVLVFTLKGALDPSKLAVTRAKFTGKG